VRASARDRRTRARRARRSVCAARRASDPGSSTGAPAGRARGRARRGARRGRRRARAARPPDRGSTEAAARRRPGCTRARGLLRAASRSCAKPRRRLLPRAARPRHRALSRASVRLAIWLPRRLADHEGAFSSPAGARTRPRRDGQDRAQLAPLEAALPARADRAERARALDAAGRWVRTLRAPARTSRKASRDVSPLASPGLQSQRTGLLASKDGSGRPVNALGRWRRASGTAALDPATARQSGRCCVTVRATSARLSRPAPQLIRFCVAREACSSPTSGCRRGNAGDRRARRRPQRYADVQSRLGAAVRRAARSRAALDSPTAAAREVGRGCVARWQKA
jgi:hypothetical protein